MKIYLSHSGDSDYEAELYAPLKQSRVASDHEIFFPHDPENIDTKSKDIIAQADLVLAEVSYPSTGQGIELGWASAAGVPIVCVYKTGSKVSSSLRFITDSMYEYVDDQGLLSHLHL